MNKKMKIVTLMLLCFSLLTACSNKKDGTIICGITQSNPMNYLDDKGNWTGFDTELALLVGKKLNMSVKFKEIEWDSKYQELDDGTISCIWNGFIANAMEDDKPRSEYVDFSYGYMLNQRCVVIKADRANEFAGLEDLLDKKAVVESGSAGEEEAKRLVGVSNTLGVSTQIDTLAEVESGAADCAIIDVLLAQNMFEIGNYPDLMIADITLDYEAYAIGFKKGSDLTEKVNKALTELYGDGTLMELAGKYGLDNSLILLETFSE